MELLEHLKRYNVILASNSPRRKELLAGLGIEFSVRVVPGIDESFPENLKGEEIPLYISRKKSLAYADSLGGKDLLITADTIVWSNGVLLEKPKNEKDAERMLALLSGHTHQVITAVCLSTKNRTISFAVTSDVSFTDLTEDEIHYYVSRFHPLDKAGAYGIQEWIGYIGVESITGSFYNVMGLPVQRLYRELKKMIGIEGK